MPSPYAFVLAPGRASGARARARRSHREPDEVEEAYAHATGYAALKDDVGEQVVEALRPIRERYWSVTSDERFLSDVLERGAERARSMASGTIELVRARMGIAPAP